MTEREEFEKWAEELSFPLHHNGARYLSNQTSNLFRAFQAGRRSRQKKDEELCRDIAERAGFTYFHAAAECAAKIKETL